MSTVGFDSRAVTIDGRRVLLVSGEIHYARSPREMWPALLDRSVACGLNCIASYIFWNEHEPRRDVYDFEGQRDLRYFLDLCAERRLHVILRIGPYCCAEWNFGGFPPYLRDEPGITLRTWNRPYLARVQKYFERLLAEVRPHLASHGGPVILVQVENEYANVARRYGAAGQRYLAWVVALAQRLGVDVPTITCEGGAPGAIACVNGFSIPAERIEKHRADFPATPLIWTELWPGWYDTWGYQHHRRDVRAIAFWILDFLRRGGSGWNYYMWHGGTNLGRTTMYLQTTSYDFDAPLDEFGRVTPKALSLRALHRVLHEHAAIFLEGERSEADDRTTWRHGAKTLTLTADPAALTARLVAEDGRVLFATRTRPAPAGPTWRNRPRLKSWQSWPEPRPNQRKDAITARQPIEQLRLTRDATDYCWYSTTANFTTAGTQKLEIPRGADFFHVFCDGRLVGRSRLPLLENRGATLPQDGVAGPEVNVLERQNGDGFSHAFAFRATRGRHRLDILATALGLVKGDWQISGSMGTERKGIWHEVRLNGAAWRGWSMYPGLVGERRGPDGIAWRRPRGDRSCTWYAVTFAARPELDADYRLDAAGLGKGLLYLNDRLLGRHWLIEADGYGADGCWHDLRREGLTADPAGQPTQRHYHLPRAWLKPINRLVVFEELSFDSTRVRVQVRPSRCPVSR